MGRCTFSAEFKGKKNVGCVITVKMSTNWQGMRATFADCKGTEKEQKSCPVWAGKVTIQVGD